MTYFIRKQNHSAQICPRSLRSWLKDLGARGLDLIELGSKSGPKTKVVVISLGSENWKFGPQVLCIEILREVLIKYFFFGGGRIQVIHI